MRIGGTIGIAANKGRRPQFVGCTRAAVRQAPAEASTVEPSSTVADPAPSITALARRPAVTPLSADRYEVRFTADGETRDLLKVAQDLLRHAVPSGDISAIVKRALRALVDEHSRTKMAVVRKPQARPGPTAAGSRHVPADVRRAVYARDGGRCAFVSGKGHRCSERAFLEYHPRGALRRRWRSGGRQHPLRCRAHNGYEGDASYGTDRTNGAGTVRENFAVSWTFPPVPERVTAQPASGPVDFGAVAGAVGASGAAAA